MKRIKSSFDHVWMSSIVGIHEPARGSRHHRCVGRGPFKVAGVFVGQLAENPAFPERLAARRTEEAQA
jgi:hypothetical protein